MQTMEKKNKSMFPIRQIKRTEIIRGTRYYFIAWDGFPDEDDCWEPLSSMQSCLQYLIRFQQSRLTTVLCQSCQAIVKENLQAQYKKIQIKETDIQMAVRQKYLRTKEGIIEGQTALQKKIIKQDRSLKANKKQAKVKKESEQKMDSSHIEAQLNSSLIQLDNSLGYMNRPSVPVTKPQTSVIKHEASVNSPTVTVTKPQASVTKPSVPLTSQVPVTKPEASVNSSTVTVTNPQASVTKPSVPLANPQVPVNNPSVPVTSPTVTMTKPEASVTKPSVPLANPQVPVNNPSVTVTSPTVTMTKPEASVTKPSVPLANPQVPVNNPSVTVTSPTVTMTKPEASVTSLSVPVNNPSVPVTSPIVPVTKPSVPVSSVNTTSNLPFFNRKVFIANISHQISEEKLIEMIRWFGPLQQLQIPKHNNTRKGIAFALFERLSDAQECIKNLNGHYLYGRKMQVKWFEKRG